MKIDAKHASFTVSYSCQNVEKNVIPPFNSNRLHKLRCTCIKKGPHDKKGSKTVANVTTKLQI